MTDTINRARSLSSPQPLSTQMDLMLSAVNEVKEGLRLLSNETADIKASVIKLESCQSNMKDNQEKTHERLTSIEREVAKIGRGEYCTMVDIIQANTRNIEKLEARLEKKLEREADKREAANARTSQTIESTTKEAHFTSGKLYGAIKAIGTILAALMFLFMFAKVVLGVPG